LLRLAKLLNSYLKGLIVEALGVAVSREKQKQLFGTSLYRNALYLTITNLAPPLISFFFWIIAARFYSTDDVGLASATLSVMTLLALFSTLGFEFGLVRYLAHSGQNANRMLNTSFTIGSLTTVIFCCIFVAGVNIWSPALLILRQNPIYLAAFIIFTLTTTSTLLTHNAFIAQRHAHFAMLGSLIFNFLRLPLPVLLVPFLHSFGSIVISLGVSQIISLIVSMLFFLPRALPGFRLFPTVSRPTVNEMMHFSFANYVANMLWSFTIYVLPIMVVNVLGAEANAYFFIAWTIGGVLCTIPGATTTALFAEGSYDEKRLASDVWRCLKMTFIILVPLVAIVVIIADKLLLLYSTTYSAEGTVLLRTMALSALPLALNSIYMSILRVEKKSMVLILLTASIAVVTLALSYLLLPRMGITGIGISWLVSQGVVALGIATVFLVRRRSITARRLNA
jgi:O-antigen/teichoic acid export membrane protein